jgi:hypothetical protein
MKHYMKYYSKHPSSNHHFSFFLIKCIVLLVACNFISCKCGRTETPTSIKDIPINSCPTNQEEATKPIDLTLAGVKTSIKGAEPIQLNVANNGTQSTVCGDLKLKATRIEGVYASIVNATDQGSGEYEIALGTVAAKGNIVQVLTIMPGVDIKATFRFQLIYEGKEVDNSVDITWEKGAYIELKEVKYNENTQYITYSLANNGSEPVQQVKLKYKNKTAGIQVGGVNLGDIDQEITVDIADNLAPGDNKENQNLAKLVFGTHAKADFEFTVVYEGGATSPERHTFTPVEIKLKLELTYNESNGSVTYLIKNIGDRVAKNVKLIYNNVSTTVEEQTVLLGGKTSAETAPEELVPETGETTNLLSLDFKAQDKARFEFKVACDGITLEHLTKTEEFKAPQVELELIPIASVSTSVSTSSIHLEDNNKELKFKINQKSGSGLVDLKQLELKIQQTVGSIGFLSKPLAAAKVTEISGQQLGKLGDEITLCVNPQGEEQLKFDLQLYYKKQPIGKPLTVSWKAKKVKLPLSGVGPVPASEELQFVQLAEDIKSYKENKIGEPSSLNDVINSQAEAEKLKGKAETLTNTIKTTIPDVPLANVRESLIHQDIRVPTQNVIEKRDEFMQSAQDEVKGLLEEGRLEEAIEVFGNAVEGDANLLTKPGNKQTIEGIYKQIVQKLEAASQVFSSNTDNSNSSAKAIKLAEIAEKLSGGTRPFIESDKLKAIAKKAYTAALDILFTKSVKDLMDAGAYFMLEDAKSLAKVAKEYELEASKIEKVNKAAYTASVNSDLAIAKNKLVEAAGAKSNFLASSAAEFSFRAANFAAITAQEAQKNGFQSLENNQAVQIAYTAAADAYQTIADNNKKEADNVIYLAGVSEDAKSAHEAANNAATVAEVAKKNGFESPGTVQAAKAAYTAAAAIFLIMAERIKLEVVKYSCLDSALKNAEKAYEAADNAFIVAQEAKSYGSTATNRAVKAAYKAALEAYQALKDEKYPTIIQQIEAKIKSLP